MLGEHPGTHKLSQEKWSCRNNQPPVPRTSEICNTQDGAVNPFQIPEAKREIFLPLRQVKHLLPTSQQRLMQEILKKNNTYTTTRESMPHVIAENHNSISRKAKLLIEAHKKVLPRETPYPILLFPTS